MLGNSEKKCSKYGTFYDLPVLMTSFARPPLGGSAPLKNTYFLFLQTQSRDFMDKGCTCIY
jgi:hypothetical protein